jgi:hypothetical protein
MTKIRLLVAMGTILFSVQSLRSMDEAVKKDFMENGFKYAEQLGLLDDPDKKLEFMRNMANNVHNTNVPPKIDQKTDDQKSAPGGNPVFINYGKNPVFINYGNNGNGNMYVNYKNSIKGNQKGNQNVNK